MGVDPATLEALGLGTQTTFPNDLTEPRAVFKLDFHPTSSQMLTFRFRLDDPKETNTSVGDTAIGRVLTGETGATLKTDNTDYALIHSWVISSDTLNEARFQYSSQANDLTQVNCPGCAFIIRPTLISGKLPNQPQSFTEDRYQFLDSLSFSTGNHFFKAGVDYSHVNIDAFVPQGFDGTFIFLTDAPFDAADPSTYPFIWQGGGGNPNIKISNNIVALFLQDEWRVSPYLTLNVGLRWDYEDQAYVEHDWQNFGPRIHFAWDPTKDGKTSVRGGFGIYYDQVFLNVPLLASLYEPGRFTSQYILFPGYPDPLVPPPGGGIPLDPGRRRTCRSWIPTPRRPTRTSAASASSASSPRTWPPASISSTPAATTCSISGTPMRRTSAVSRITRVRGRTRLWAPRWSPRPKASPSTLPSRWGSRGGSPIASRPSSRTTCRATRPIPTAARPFRATTTTRARTGVRA